MFKSLIFSRFLAAAGGFLITLPNVVHAQALSDRVEGTITLGQGMFENVPEGYEVEERFLGGIANRYESKSPPTENGEWTLVASGSAEFKTRLVVVRPKDAEKFNGTVVVEWLNVSGGTDAAPDWNYLHRELVRNGYAYVAVSAQKVGIDGGPMAFPGVQPIKRADPDRYGALVHPGDAYAMDMFSQAGKAVRQSASNGLLGSLEPMRVLAIGESQSAGFLTTYVNGVEPLEHVYDGYLIHSRFGGAAPLDGDYLVGMQGQTSTLAKMSVRIRSDVSVPVLMFITETDLMAPLRGYLSARQDDSANIRTWEVAGTAHADSYILTGAALDTGSAPIDVLAKAFTPTTDFFGQQLEKPMNAAPQHHYVLQAALAALDNWMRNGIAPASRARLETDGAGLEAFLKTDEVGNAVGGIRSPWVDVPTSKLSGLGQPVGGFAFLFGSTEQFDEKKLQQLYPGGESDYLRKFEKSLDDAICAGNILPDDRQEILSLAEELY